MMDQCLLFNPLTQPHASTSSLTRSVKRDSLLTCRKFNVSDTQNNLFASIHTGVASQSRARIQLCPMPQQESVSNAKLSTAYSVKRHRKGGKPISVL